METLTTDNKTINLDEHRVTPGSVNGMLTTLRELYPKAYKLRETVANPVAVSHGGNYGVVYCVLHDDEDHYPRVVYLLWNGTAFKKIVERDTPARIINGIGIFFLSEETLWRQVQVSHSNIFPSQKDEYYVSEETSDFYTVLRMETAPDGIFVEGRGKDSTITNVSFFSIGMGRSEEPVKFPEWADRNTWQPTEEGCIFFSDATSIYKMSSGKHNTPKRMAMMLDSETRLGDTHDWMPSPFVEIQMPLFGEAKKDFLILGKTSGSSEFSTGKELPYGLESEKFYKTWIPFHSGFVKLHEHGPDLMLHYLYLKNDEWNKVCFLKKEKCSIRTVSFFESNIDEFFLGIKEQRYLITWEMVRKAL